MIRWVVIVILLFAVLEARADLHRSVPEKTERRPATRWQRLVCALWWGHRPVYSTWTDFGAASEMLECRCAKVTDTLENVERYVDG